MRRAGPVPAPQRPSVGSSQVAEDGLLHFQRIGRSDFAVDDFSARSDHQRVGDRAGPFLVQGLGERVVVTCLEDVIGRRDVVLLEDPDRLGLLLRIVEADRQEPERAAPVHPVIVTNSGNSATHGPHQVAQTLITVSLLPASFTSLATPATSIGSRVTGSASHQARDLRASACFSARLVEQPKTRVFSTGTGFPASRATTAVRASCDLTAFTSASSKRPT